MLKEKTCLILGAGASRPYLLPTSGELRNIILGGEHAEKAFKSLEWDSEVVSDPVSFYDDLLKEPRVEKGLLQQFRREFFNAQRFSIDSFLSQRKADFESVGKLAIAAAILMCENERRLNANWYQWLLERIIEDGADFPAEMLSVITFNYDRSLERFLWRAFRHSFKISDVKADEMLGRIEILHVYGDVGQLRESDPFEYGSLDSLLKKTWELKSATDRIKVVAPRTVPETSARAKQMIQEAERICFLGFGFWKENLDLLGFKGQLLKPVFASCYQLSRGIKMDVLERFGTTDHSLPTINFGTPDQDVLTFLTHWNALR